VKLIGAKQLSQMKPSAFLINTARGGLIDSEALIAALENRVIAGAAIDVLDSEPPSHDEPLLTVSYPNLLITPHNAWGARESRQRLILQMAENIERFISGNPIRCVV
jgi:glycerate dehydrogenase